MLQRVLEPEAMDTADEARQYDSMDHAAVNRVFVTDFLFAAAAAGLPLADDPQSAGHGSGEPGRWIDVLDLGAGTAQIPIELCRRVGNVRVLAGDLAIEMLNVARVNVEIAGLRERIRLDRIDAKQLDFADDSFSAVISNSIVHHIPAPEGALAEAARVTRRAGLIFFRDLLRPENDADVARLVDLHATGANETQRALFEASLRAAFNLEEIRSMVGALGFPVDTVTATSDRHWTWIGRH